MLKFVDYQATNELYQMRNPVNKTVMIKSKKSQIGSNIIYIRHCMQAKYNYYDYS